MIIKERLLEEGTRNMSVISSFFAQNHILASILSNLFLFLLIFGLSVTVPVQRLRHQLRNKWALCIGIFMQFIIMPALGFLAIRLGNMPFTTGLTLLVVTSSPGGSYSNWWCSVFNADLALSVAMTAISTILSIGLLPANLLLYSRLSYRSTDVVEAIDFSSLFLSLGIVIGGILLGLVVSLKLGQERERCRKWANRGANLSGIALIVFSALISSSSTSNGGNLWGQEWKVYVVVAFPCLVGLSLSNVLGRILFRLNKPECVTIAIECAYQNVGIAVSVAITIFTDEQERAQALVVPLYYGLVEAIVIAIYCLWAWKLGWTKAPAKENFCVIVSNSYEVDNEVDDQNNSKNDHSCGQEQDEDSFGGDFCETDFMDSLTNELEEGSGPSRNRLISEDNTTVSTTIEDEHAC